MSIKLKFRESTVQGKNGVLYFQIIHEKSIRRLNTAHHITPSEWDAQNECVIMPSPQSPRYNKLCAIISDIDWEMKRFAMLEKAHDGKSIDELVAAFQGKGADGKGLFDFMRSQSERLRKLNRERCSETMMQTLRSFMKFRGGIDICLEKLTKDIVEQYEAWLKGRGLKRNTSSFYLRTLRNAYNIAVDEGLTDDKQLFRKVYTGVDKTIKRAIGIEDIRAIKRLDLRNTPSLEMTRDILMFSFYMRGMSFVDMAYLSKKNLQGPRIVYCRKKTGQQLTIEVLPEAKEIIDKYESDSQYLLPIIKTENGDVRRQCKNAITMVNRNLKKIGAMVGLTDSLTTYVMRHSWATIARNKGIGLSVISEGLGHDNEATTQIYLDSISTSRVDKANRSILDDL
ncbi:MAG: site-specific integrase [Bacteroidaceae bacterium]|nr:site-specific integrase [Bacteroidaceae bacterium]